MTEVTESEFAASGVREDYQGSSDFPAGNVTWDEAALYCNSLTATKESRCYTVTEENGQRRVERAADHLMKDGYRLPTEAEWEFASRAFSRSNFCFGSDIELIQRYGYISSERGEVAGKRPNVFGLFDAHGGLSEWCDDDPAPYERSPEGQCPDDWGRQNVNPRDRLERIVRGGNYEATESQSRQLTCFTRGKVQFRYGQPYIGFRPARTVTLPLTD
jgi:formylglycine-generating enzyme required for sulfatase activity